MVVGAGHIGAGGGADQMRWVISDLGLPHSLMAFEAAFSPSFGISMITMSWRVLREGSFAEHRSGFCFSISSVRYEYRFFIMDFSPITNDKILR